MQERIYLDNAATTFPKSKEVHDFMYDFYQALVHELLGTNKISGTVRFSLGPFNTEEDSDKAMEAVQDIASTKKHEH
jgi:cysteine sulfinate desulfinase/cysteine desulfurase-like protein